MEREKEELLELLLFIYQVFGRFMFSVFLKMNWIIFQKKN